MKKIILIDLQTLIVCIATGIFGGLAKISTWFLFLFILTLLFGRTPFSLLIKKMNEHLEEVSTVLMIDFLASVIVLVLCGTFLDMKSFMGFSTVMALFMRIVAHMSILKPELEWRWAVSKKETL